jgi:uncharacterized protein YjlB
VAHKNLGGESAITCVGGYPGGISFDMNYGKPGERPATDVRIGAVDLPEKGPLCGEDDPLISTWSAARKQAPVITMNMRNAL